MRILIVDDEGPARRMFRFALEAQHELYEAADGTAGLEVMRTKGGFDVVLLDLRMPGMSGLETLNRMHRLAPQTAIVVITAYSSFAVPAQAMRAGATHFLSKPTDPNVLRAAVAATRRRAVPPDLAITLNGFTVEPADEAPRTERDGSVEYAFHVSHALESWNRVVSVRLGPQALQRTVARHQANVGPVAAEVARRTLADHLWREGMLPPPDGLVVDEADASLVAAVVSEADTVR